MIIREIIVVEGKNDVAAVKNAVEAECIVTNGLKMGKKLWRLLEKANEKSGIIVLTDPDTPGEYIRRTITKHFPQAKHAYVAKKNALKKNDVGIEQASAASIVEALKKAHCVVDEKSKEFSIKDLLESGLVGSAGATVAREIVGDILGIGYTNAKQFLRRMNSYGINREEFEKALMAIKDEQSR